ncbi:uncharacterized protein LOC134846555 [Symsagittifera roscoffensis]|uniref:uncharacterized protein LOC134846555 n=1 Tax=Symsagittifera roscoffensis TaxID=84072 RepID=UPI00307BBF19
MSSLDESSTDLHFDSQQTPFISKKSASSSKVEPTDILYSLLFATTAFFAVFLSTVVFIAIAFWCGRKFCEGFSSRKNINNEEGGAKLSRQRSIGSAGGGQGGGGSKRKFLTPAFSASRTSTL